MLIILQVHGSNFLEIKMSENTFNSAWYDHDVYKGLQLMKSETKFILLTKNQIPVNIKILWLHVTMHDYNC